MPSYGFKRARLGVLFAAAMAAVILAGCGSSSSSSSAAATASSATSTAASPTVTAAKALVAKFSEAGAPLAVPPLPHKPPTGKTVYVLTCGFPSCQATTAGVVSGAKALGWNVKTFTSPITPEGYTATWNQMLQTPPDAIVYTGLLPDATIKPQLAKVAQLKIPAVGIAGWDPPGGVLKAVYSGIPTLTQSGHLMGAAIVADANGPAKTVFVWDPNTLMGPVKTAFEQTVKGAGGSVDILPINLANTGTVVPGQIVTYLQSHPDVKYVAFGISDFAAGVPQAIKAAGITGVKIVSRAAHPTDVANIANGTEWMSVAEETSGSGYRAVDALARIFEGVPVDAFPAGWARVIEPSTVPSTNQSSVLNQPGVPSSFLTAWHVG